MESPPTKNGVAFNFKNCVRSLSYVVWAAAAYSVVWNMKNTQGGSSSSYPADGDQPRALSSIQEPQAIPPQNHASTHNQKKTSQDLRSEHQAEEVTNHARNNYVRRLEQELQSSQEQNNLKDQQLAILRLEQELKTSKEQNNLKDLQLAAKDQRIQELEAEQRSKKAAANHKSLAKGHQPPLLSSIQEPQGLSLQNDTSTHNQKKSPRDLWNEHTEKSLAEQETTTVVFFNMYSHPRENFALEFYPHAQGLYSSTGIFKEQMTQIVKARFETKPLKYDGPKETIQVFVSTFGNPNMTDPGGIQSICDKVIMGEAPYGEKLSIRCTAEEHKEEGGELDTLTNMYNYCQKAPASTRVSYLHNKGSFNPGRDQHRWRRAMTEATFHRDCINPPDDTCSVCGLQFVAPPMMYMAQFPGNFFTTSCGYLQQLLPPKTFHERLEVVAEQALDQIQSGKLVLNSQKDRKPWSLGQGRYSAEHWIATHPQVKPCHMYPHLRVQYYWRHHDHKPQEFEWSMFPGPTLTYNQSKIPEALAENPDRRLRYNNYLPGLLFRQIQLYNQTPPLDSWWYEYMPDGAFWRDAVQKYGNEAVAKVTDPTFDRKGEFQKFA